MATVHATLSIQQALKHIIVLALLHIQMRYTAKRSGYRLAQLAYRNLKSLLAVTDLSLN